jgi:ABC-type nickel/cobalt efflux system permease component RcnA
VVYVTGVSKLKVSVIIYSATLRAAVFLNLVIAVLTVTAAAVLLQTNWTMLRLEVCNCNK